MHSGYTLSSAQTRPVVRLGGRSSPLALHNQPHHCLTNLTENRPDLIVGVLESDSRNFVACYRKIKNTKSQIARPTSKGRNYSENLSACQNRRSKYLSHIRWPRSFVSLNDASPRNTRRGRLYVASLHISQKELYSSVPIPIICRRNEKIPLCRYASS